jgi:hypothetical protein
LFSFDVRLFRYIPLCFYLFLIGPFTGTAKTGSGVAIPPVTVFVLSAHPGADSASSGKKAENKSAKAGMGTA